MHPLRLRSAAALLTVIAGVATLAGCSGSDHDSAVPEDYTLWMNQAFTQLNGVAADNEGGAGGRLTVEDGSKRAHAHVSLEYDLAGPYDVLAACRSSKTVHLTIRDFTTDRDAAGDDRTLENLLGQADITCGKTSRIPIEVAAGRSGVALDASTTDRSGKALFDTLVVSRGAGQ